MLEVVFAIATVGVIVTSLARPTAAYPTAAVFVVLMAVFVHPEASFFGLASFVLSQISLVCAARLRAGVRLSAPPWPVVLFVGYATLAYLIEDSSPRSLGYRLGLALCYLLVAALARTLGPELVPSMLKASTIAAPLLLLQSFREVFLGANAIWPRRDGYTFRLSGGNNLLPFLEHRAMATTGYAITLGVVASFLAVFSFLAWRQGLGGRWQSAACVLVVLFSGTRSALLAVVLAGAWILLSSRRWRVPATFVMIGGFCVLVADAATLRASFLSSDVVASDSFTHRAAVAQSVSLLLERPWADALFGGGYGSIAQAASAGLLPQLAQGSSVTDNEFVRQMVALGLVGVVLLVSALVRAWLHTPAMRPLVIWAAAAMFFYDVGTWQSLMILLFIVLGAEIRPYAPVNPVAGKLRSPQKVRQA